MRTSAPAPPPERPDHGRARRCAGLRTPAATPRRDRLRRWSRRRPPRGARMRTARPLRHAARECVRTNGPFAAPRPVGRVGGGDPYDQRGGGWSGLPARRSRSCTWSSAFRVSEFLNLFLSSSGSCGESSLSLFSLLPSSDLWPLSGGRSSPLGLVVQQPALLGQHPLGPRRWIPQLDPIDGS